MPDLRLTPLHPGEGLADEGRDAYSELQRIFFQGPAAKARARARAKAKAKAKAAPAGRSIVRKSAFRYCRALDSVLSQLLWLGLSTFIPGPDPAPLKERPVLTLVKGDVLTAWQRCSSVSSC